MSMVNEFGFIHASALWWMAVVIPLVIFLMHRERVRRARLAMFGIQKKQGWTPVRLLLPPLILLLVAFSLGRPFWGYEDVTIHSSGRDIFALIDVSKSMLAKDIAPTRLNLAKRKLKDLFDLLEEKSPGDRVGLILFAGDAYLYCPLTPDFDVLRVFVDSISTELVSSEGTSISAAVKIAVESAKRAVARKPVAIILSDGEEASPDISSSVDSLHLMGIPVYAIGIGTAQGIPIELSGGRFVKDAAGNIVVSKLVESGLESLAKETGGIYRRATLDDSDIKEITGAVTEKDKETGDEATIKTFRVYNEIGWISLWAALLLVLLALAASRRVNLLLSMFLVTQLPLPARADDKGASSAQSYYDAARAYEEGRYDEAISVFEDALKKNPKDNEVAQALGNAYYKAKRFDDAKKVFEQITRQSSSGRELFESNYNLGNTEFMKGNFDEAITRYETALKIKPKDERAEFNRDLAKKMLEQKKKEEQKQEEEKKKQDKKNDDASSENSQNQDSKPNDDKKGADSKPDDQNQEKRPDKKDNGESGTGDKAQGQSPSPTPSGQNEKDSNEGDKAKEKESGKDLKAQNPTPAPTGAGQQKNSAAKAKPLGEREAEAWLESLPDAPLLLQKKVGGVRPRDGQTW